MEQKHFARYKIVSGVLLALCLLGAFVASVLQPNYWEDLRIAFHMFALLYTGIVAGVCNRFSGHPDYARPIFQRYYYEERIGYNFAFWFILWVTDAATGHGNYLLDLHVLVPVVYLWYRVWVNLKTLIFDIRIKRPVDILLGDVGDEEE